MKKYKELLILKNLRGIGKATIYKRYWDVLEKIDHSDELIDIVRERETGISDSDIQEAIDKAEKTFSLVNRDPDLKIITVFDEIYPTRLAVMKDKRPLILYAKGNTDILNQPNIAIIGTRKPSQWSQAVEERLVGKILELSNRVIVSGLALGCDKIGHETTVKKGQSTVAVLPSGVNIITPASHKSLAADIVSSNGCLLSEYEPGVAATKSSYVERDAIVAALSDGTFVIECDVKSGTMHTARFAQEFLRKLACYKCDNPSKGNYAGNDYMLHSMNAVGVADTEDLEKFLDKLDERKEEDNKTRTQMTIEGWMKNTIDVEKAAEKDFANKFKDAHFNCGLIFDLDISIRSANCLRKAGIISIDELLECDEERLKEIDGLTPKYIKEILELIEELKVG